MKSIVFRGVAATSAAAALTSLAGVASAATIKGTVVHHNNRAQSFVVASTGGRLVAIHSARAPRIGSEVLVAAKRLHDGTFALQRVRTVGHARSRVRIRGVVSWADPHTGAFTVSAAGVSMLVVRHSGLRAHDAGAGSSTTTPQVGSDVVATGSLDSQGDLEDQTVQDVGQVSGAISLEGTILSIDPTAQTITVSADDDNQSGAVITVSVPSSFDLTQFTQGQEVELMVQPTGTGTATLLGSAEDGNASLANSQSDGQGQNPASGDSCDQQGSGTTTTTDTTTTTTTTDTTTTTPTTTDTTTTPTGGGLDN